MIKNIIGQKFGMLEVIKNIGRAKSGNAIWQCKCECGNITKVETKNLNSGGTKSCGCKRGGRIDITNQKFGKLTAIKPIERKSKQGGTIWKCKCECGKTKEVKTMLLRNGTTKSCGCSLRKDITGQKIGHYKIIKPTEKRDNGGSVIWKCKNLKTKKTEEISSRKLTKLKQKQLAGQALLNPPATL